ncbi:hypothetical protein ACHAWU_009266 [Discostella pseudostelligera]|uniref:SET domain-containing protein n=1 Tax=Discostella pseudostelligera TaxID=259834 RepID=A0ABD3MB86_9STRA
MKERRMHHRFYYYYSSSITIIICLHRHLGAQAIPTRTDAAAAVLFTRFDRDAYLNLAGDAARRRRGRDDDASVNYFRQTSPTKNFDDDQQQQQQQQEKDARINNSQTADQQNYDYDNYDDPDKCTVYLAPSSIPHSGLGMYTTIPYTPGTKFFPEIGIFFHDKHRQYLVNNDRPRLSAQYPWLSSALSFGAFDAAYGESYIPGIGMLTNSHLGLVNFRLSEPWMMQRSMDGTDSLFYSDSLTLDDVGRGAYTTHGHVMFEAVSHIEAGEEMFVSYGDEWFTSREEALGIVPGGDDFTEADELLRIFSETHLQNNDQLLGEDGVNEGEEQWDDDSDDTLANLTAEYEMVLRNASEKGKRLRAALPDNVQDVPAALELGTARFSAKDSIQSLEWLEENGACLDNIVSGVSSIPQAGRGAFATRSIKEGDQITTTPVLTFDREELLLWESVEKMDDGGLVMELLGQQLLVNYCYGHANSSLLFFPYAPTVNFINHGSIEESNAEIRWSRSPYHKAEWLHEPLEDVKSRMKTGLMFDIIATRDLSRGDEILLYYGKDWEEGWMQHISEWSPTMDSEHPVVVDDDDDDNNATLPHLNLTDSLGHPTTSDLNVIEKTPIVRTVDEQADNPYPSYIMTICRFEPPEECVTQNMDGACISRWTHVYEEKDLYRCSILSRRPYSKDHFAYGTFRQVIGLPDGLLPPHWMDLNSTLESDN